MSHDATRRVVLNQHLVKERDEARARELRRLAWICAGLLIPILFYVWQQIEFIRTGYQIEQLRAEKIRLTEWNRQMKLERATLSNLKRIEQLGRARLGLVPPDPENTVKIRLTGDSAATRSVAQSSPPAGGLIAAER
ncbi:MAG TPA: cell division protein FtsL [Candidatus Polarisedimenticolia bacterium]|nr:cell division protein FtsL [Candidatus Polarisedimenticolia bacterium]